jgi:thioredoxin reductase
VLVDYPATTVEQAGVGFKVNAEDGIERRADYLVLAEGKGADLAEMLGLEKTEHGIASDADGRSSINRLYVVGRATRPNRSQAIIAAGHGAAAALDILASEVGKDFLDYDSVD